MTELERIWVEHYNGEMTAIRIDWDNDRHQRIVLNGKNPLHVIEALRSAAFMLEEELYKEEI